MFSLAYYTLRGEEKCGGYGLVVVTKSTVRGGDVEA